MQKKWDWLFKVKRWCITTDFYNFKFSWKLGKFSTKHVFIDFSRKPIGFEIFSKIFETYFEVESSRNDQE